MKRLRQFLMTACVALGALTSAAEAPAGYYSTAENKGGRDLLVALYNKIGDHTVVSYSGLLDLYKTSDVYPDGKIWDMYSTKHWNTSETCGNYSLVGDCYNREHSFPKSWFDDASPMYSDAFHIYPTDGKVNGQRSNYPFGECANGTYLPANGNVRPLGRLGSSTFSGYSGTVFEPDDQYKGDFARSYFYMATAYYNKIGGWDSPMLSGSNHPAFSSWAINLLLKWHREDPVSDKERDRNDVVYGRQRNRNPYIDYPDMVEYIWGNRQNETWSSAGSQTASFELPAEGAAIDFGTIAVNHPASKTFQVKTVSASEAVSVSTSGGVITASPASIDAAAANAGATVTVTFSPVAAGNVSGTVFVKMGTLSRNVAVSGRAVDGLPAGPARYISDRSFTATWVYVGDDSNGNYTLDVRTGGQSIDGYPRTVNATDGQYEVRELDPATTYTYTVASRTMISEPVTAVTGEPIPSIEILFDGELYFVTSPGEASEAAELLIESENIDGDITVSVGTPFELSTNHSDWTRQLVLGSDDDRFYLRLNPTTEGSFSAKLIAAAANYTAEAITVSGVASDSPSFHEDFEPDAEGHDTYDGHSGPYQGTACAWELDNVGIWTSDGGHESSQSLRFGKRDNSSITMASDCRHGIGTVTFYAKYWNKEPDPVIAVQTSTDGGETFTTAGSVTVSSADWAEYSVFVGVSGLARLRFLQTAGQRLNFDDVYITDYTSGVADIEAERHQWDAYSLNGCLTVKVSDALAADIFVYAIDGTTVYAGRLPEGENSISVAPGLYIVACGDFSRRVVVR